MSNYQHIVVGTDFSLSAQTALFFAAAIARDSDAKISVVHCHSPKQSSDLGFGGFHPQRDMYLQMLKEFTQSLESVTIDHHFFESEDQVGKLTQFAQEARADLIVLGGRGHGSSADVPVGPFVQEVFEKASCPVLISTTDVAALRELQKVR